MPLLSCDDILVNETAGFAILTLRLDAAAAVPLSVTWNTSSSSADSGSDYTGVGATVLTFAAGQTVRTVQVPLINDAFIEGNENFFINLSSPSAGLTLERSFAIVTIAANDRGDRAPVASVADIVVDEGNGTANFAITLDPCVIGSGHRDLYHQQRHGHGRQRLYRYDRLNHVCGGRNGENSTGQHCQ
jgi:hypothetical protein